MDKSLITLFITLIFSKRIFVISHDCISLDITITQNIEKLGFHRDLNWLIEAKNLNNDQWLNASCQISLRFNVGVGMYVSPDQADDLRRLGKLDVKIDGFVDIEAPAHEGSKHVAYIFMNSSQLSEKIAVKLPVHLRYQQSMMGGHGKVILTKPSFLVRCKESNNIICGKNRKVTAPASSDDFENLVVWKNVTYTEKFGETELLVPIGNLNDYSFVAIITCLLGCGGCVYILSLISKVHDDDDKKSSDEDDEREVDEYSDEQNVGLG